ncbi:MAG: hypothetical protein ACE15F_11215 [bacterium]
MNHVERAREEEIEKWLPVYEGRLMDQAGWDGLSALLEDAPPWREELNHRWEGREDWQAFLEWEKEFKATREREVEDLVKMVVDRLTGKTGSESWSRLSPAREEQIKQNIQYFEDLLMKPNQAGWARLSDIAGGWQVLLDRRGPIGRIGKPSWHGKLSAGPP